MAKIKRSLIQSFLNTGTLVAPVWSQIGSGVASAKLTYNPKVESQTDIINDNASVTVESYGPTLPVEMIANNGDAVFEFLDALRKSRATLSDAETEVVNVWLYETPTSGYYEAEKQSVTISIEDIGGDGGVSAKLNYTLQFIGNPTLGGFKPAATATFTALPVNTILTTLVIGSVTLSPTFASNKAWLWHTGSVSNATTTVTMTSTLSGATILQKDKDGTTVAQGDPATLAVGANDLTVKVTVGTEEVTYHIVITRAAS